MYRTAFMTLIAALPCADAVAAAALAPSAVAKSVVSPAQDAWQRYRQLLADQRIRFLAHPWAGDPQLRAQGLYFLQSLEAVAFNLYVAPRPHYPALYTQSFFMPFELSWGMPNPDFLNRNGFIDGAHTYRIHGNRRGNRWATLQLFRGFWGDDVQGTLGNVDFDDLPAAPDGSFDIFLGPNPPADTKGAYWVKLDPNRHNMMLALRETFFDWTKEMPMDVHIEMLDREGAAPITFDENELALRIARAAKWASTSFDFALAGVAPFVESAGTAAREMNRFYANATGRQQGGNPLGSWNTMLYEIASDEALVIETPAIAARYWGYQLGSVWGQTTDYSYHQSSLNIAQVQPDPDGKIRVVLALSDPGVPNWLDPAGIPKGLALLRIYKGDGEVMPTVTRVKLAELRHVLPSGTPQVSAIERRAALDARRAASLRRYGQ